jgi:hypothetical protein
MATRTKELCNNKKHSKKPIKEGPTQQITPRTSGVEAGKTDSADKKKTDKGIAKFEEHLLVQMLSASVTQYEQEKVKGTSNGLDKIVSPIADTFFSIDPKDSIEGMLATQMIGLHSTAMRLLKRMGNKEISTSNQESNVNMATKLIRTFTACSETLNRHRGKGQQKVTVEHVTVNQGGQAIVGNIEAIGSGGRDGNKN